MASDTTTQDWLDDLSQRRGKAEPGYDNIWFLELDGAKVIEPTAFEPDPATFQGNYYYNVITNVLYKKIITRNEPGIITAYWKKTSE